jgi:hypothetical protein
MLDPFHVTGHDILSAKLTPLPVVAPLQPAHPLTDVLVDLINSKHQPALATLLVMRAVDTVFQQVVSDFS